MLHAVDRDGEVHEGTSQVVRVIGCGGGKGGGGGEVEQGLCLCF